MNNIDSKSGNNFYRMSIAIFVSMLIVSIVCIMLLLQNELTISHANILQIFVDNDYQVLKMLGVALMALIICAMCLFFETTSTTDSEAKKAAKQLEELELE